MSNRECTITHDMLDTIPSMWRVDKFKEHYSHKFMDFGSPLTYVVASLNDLI